MKSKVMLAAMAAVVATPMAVSAPAQAQYRGDHYYHGRDRSGGAGGALLGNALGGGTLGTIAGGVGGALLGKHLDKKHDAAQNRRNGC
jgi:hypothetical protein